jgi:hypothetical protein
MAIRSLETAIISIVFPGGVMSAADSVDFQRQILPLLHQRCFSCHSEKKEKPKGGLRLDSAAEIRNSGVLEPGQPERSELFIRVELPHADDEFMPPLKGGGKPLSGNERALLHRWIGEGADFGGWSAFEHREAPLSTPADIQARPDLLTLVERINEWVSRYHEREGSQLNSPVTDTVFLRRVFLDVGGRIPSPAESARFFGKESPEKRSELISSLLKSEAYVSHTFNWKADQLRLLGDSIPGQPTWLYDDWVKESVRSGMPQDEFARQLLTGSGYLWENGAVGFYLRDKGMPLDHLSNLTRVFLGTRMECAQCHDDPLTPITQRDFYQMAAYTYGVSNMANPAGYSVEHVKQWPELKRLLESQKADAGLRNGVSRTVSYLKRGTSDTGYELNFPDDYAYNKELRGTKVEARTPFGDEAFANDGTRREAFAEWMVSPRNPRFARNLANRLWKRVMGAGLVEPVDSLGPFPSSANEGLLDLLTEIAVQLEFDERAILEVVLNTRIYQAESVRTEPEPGEAMDLKGPLLRRLSAEQVWDSILVFLVEGLDERRSLLRHDGSELDPARLRELTRMSAEEILERARREMAFRLEQRAFQLWQREQRQLISEAGSDVARGKALREELAQRSAEFTQLAKEIGMAGRYFAKETDPRWKHLPRDLFRASELPTPIPLSHFLRQFGQSDRREIDAFNREPNSTHSLALMNGKLTTRVLAEDSFLRKQLPSTGADLESRIESIYRAILIRDPGDHEMNRCLKVFEASPTPEEDLIWALINNPEFLFLQ